MTKGVIYHLQSIDIDGNNAYGRRAGEVLAQVRHLFRKIVPVVKPSQTVVKTLVFKTLFAFLQRLLHPFTLGDVLDRKENRLRLMGFSVYLWRSEHRPPPYGGKSPHEVIESGLLSGISANRRKLRDTVGAS
jgi:hypothetical protein